jgi:hypothetical protein
MASKSAVESELSQEYPTHLRCGKAVGSEALLDHVDHVEKLRRLLVMLQCKSPCLMERACIIAVIDALVMNTLLPATRLKSLTVMLIEYLTRDP